MFIKKSLAFVMASCFSFVLLTSGCDSDDDGTVTGGTTCTDDICITAPATGAVVEVGKEYKITWKVNSSNVAKINVKFSNDDGITWTELTTSSIDPSVSTEFSWTPDGSQAGTSCKVKVYDYTDESVNAESGTFEVK